MVSGFPSTSVSFASSAEAATTTGVSSLVVSESLPATGASLTAVTLIFTVAVVVPPWPSLTV
jgi:hypothetical protein